MNSIKVCEYSWSRSFHDDLILQDQASGERSQDQWSSGSEFITHLQLQKLALVGRKLKRHRLLKWADWSAPLIFDP